MRDVNDSVGLTKLIRDLNHGHLAAGEELTTPTNFLIAGAANPLFDSVERLERKLEAGVRLLQSNLVYDIDRFVRWLAPITEAGIVERAPLLVGVTPPRSTRMLRHMHDNIPGVEVPDAISARMDSSKIKMPRTRVLRIRGRAHRGSPQHRRCVRCPRDGSRLGDRGGSAHRGVAARKPWPGSYADSPGLLAPRRHRPARTCRTRGWRSAEPATAFDDAIASLSRAAIGLSPWRPMLRPEWRIAPLSSSIARLIPGVSSDRELLRALIVGEFRAVLKVQLDEDSWRLDRDIIAGLVTKSFTQAMLKRYGWSSAAAGLRLS